MYEELVNVLRDTASLLCDYVSKSKYHKPGKKEQAGFAMRYAADAIEYLVRLRNAAEENRLHWQRMAVEFEIAMHTAEEKLPKWIPVKERLPEEKINPNTHDFEYVLCATIWGDVRPFKYGKPIGNKDAHFWNGAGYVDAYITHWMPLPTPPKEETE